jgi:N-acetylmuramoyl-L-alanine amidase
VRFHWLFLSALTGLLVAAPAMAGKLVFWRFDNRANRLLITTDGRVQPRAQMITNPTRVVLDFPGIKLGQPNVNQNVGSTIRSIRIGQFDADTTRVVIELAPGYTLDPQAVKIRGLSPTQWTVELPEPQPITDSSPTPTPPEPSPRSSIRERPPIAASPPPPQANTNSDDFQITRNGLFVRLERNGDERSIRVQRGRDGKKIDIELPGAVLPSGLQGQTFPVNRYGVGDIQFSQSSDKSARVSLSVTASSPDWQALYSRFGGLVLLPRGGLSAVEDAPSPPPSNATNPPRDPPTRERLATIASIEIPRGNDRLLIRADRPLKANGKLNSAGIYEIRIDNARLADSFRGPQLGRDSPIYQLRVRQENPDRVVIAVLAAEGFQTGQLSQGNTQALSLELRSSPRISRPPVDSSRPDAIVIGINPPAFTDPPPNPTPDPTPPRAQPRNGRILVMLDPGHGGKDPGAIGIGGLQEKDVILPVSLEVARLLQQQGIDVRLTRDSDFFVTLQGRTDLANQIDADIFVSIHANSMGKGRPDVNGMETYFFGDRRLSDILHRNMLRSVEMNDRGVRRARFYVLRNARMPSTLLELGFVTGAEDSQKLRDPNFQKRLAAGIARGIIEYIQKYIRG